VASVAETPWPLSQFSRPEPLLFLSSSFSFILTRLSGPCSRPTCYSENLVAPGIEPSNLPQIYPKVISLLPSLSPLPFKDTFGVGFII
jgi:hypothetical protein